MKQLLYITCMVTLCASVGHSQGESTILSQRSRENLLYLTDSRSLLNRVQIDAKGITLSTREYNRPEFLMYWDEVNRFIDVIESHDPYSLQLMYQNKKAGRFANKEGETTAPFYNGFPSQFKNLKIALDPGHFGGGFNMAWLEGRIVKVKGSDLGQANDAKFFEADLTYQTALLLKNRLEEQGAEVLITRPQGAGAMDMDFDKWLKTAYTDDLIRTYRQGEIKKNFYDTLRKAYTDTLKTTNRYHLFQFYKFLDFQARARKINDFHPNVTFVIHFNASEGSRAYGKERFTKPVTTNYSMAFVPGSFEHDELEKVDQKIDFLRLLLSPDLTNSMRLADLWVKKHNSLLGVPPVPYDSLRRMKDVIIRTPYEGVFCRNLYLTRAVRGIVVYGESLYQDNINEAKALSKKDYVFTSPVTQVGYAVPQRCVVVAEAYFEALKEFLALNEKQQKVKADSQAQPHEMNKP